MSQRTLLSVWVALGVLVIAWEAPAAEHPSEILNLSRWKLTTPFDSRRAGRPDEITQPELDRYVHPQCFFLSDDEKAVVFRAHCGGATTKNSGFPRCELREMAPGGKDEIAWSTADSGLHSLKVELAIKDVPDRKPHVVCVQIHDDEDDLLMIRLEDHKLFIERNDVGDVRLDSDYQLGQRCTIRIQAGEGQVRVWYNGEQKLDWKVKRKGCYFKVGCYTQSNAKKGDQPDAAGEVWVYSLQFDHTELSR